MDDPVMATKPNQEDHTLASLPADRQQIVVQVQVSEVGAPGCIREKLHAYLIYSRPSARNGVGINKAKLTRPLSEPQRTPTD